MKNYNLFDVIVKETCRKQIPIGCFKQHILGITPDTNKKLPKYTIHYEIDLFSRTTIEEGM